MWGESQSIEFSQIAPRPDRGEPWHGRSGAGPLRSSAGPGRGGPRHPRGVAPTPASATAAWPTDDWWTGFGSPELNALIDLARKQNFDIAAAIARVRQADAQVRIAGAPLLPTLNGTASAGWESLALPPAAAAFPAPA